VTGCNDPIATPTAGNTVQNLQWKNCQGSPVILIELLEHQQTPPFQILIHPREQKKVTRNEVG